MNNCNYTWIEAFPFGKGNKLSSFLLMTKTVSQKKRSSHFINSRQQCPTFFTSTTVSVIIIAIIIIMSSPPESKAVVAATTNTSASSSQPPAEAASSSSSTTTTATTSTQAQPQAPPPTSNYNRLLLDPIVADPKSHVDFILAVHKQLPKAAHRECCGGIFPMIRDPITNEHYFVMGLSKKSSFNSFYGFVDANETVPQGAAREGYEESKGEFTDLVTFWRATMTQGYFSRIVGKPASNNYLVHLGEMNALERSTLKNKFSHNPGWSACSREIPKIEFFEVKTMKHLCLTAAEKFYKKKQQIDKGELKNEKLSSPFPEVVVRINEESGRREILRASMSHAMTDRRFWENDLFDGLINKNMDLKEFVLPLSCLPPLDKATAAILPFKRSSAAAAASTSASSTSKR